ncbi:SnoaL-like domain-containing protein [Nocardioides scoriae]|uniref:SnoaL-like domain-containing protein n=1 Tax=Nocardioides scoriae TaxID=642780 RepID=A0A1H1U8D5_9ACTN|nr:nuclear transport factor 2 family protein [Nocardioides scoriae]SDS68805.1 SnoaL-like domain-containing protein [Nocardioides scoriae]
MIHELAEVYRRYLDEVAWITRSGAWGSYADLFDQDAIFHRSGFPDVRGREAIRAMILTEATTLPGSLIERTDILWHALDLRRRLVVQEMRHVARDPGDGSQHQALATSVLRLGADGLWSRLDVVHSPEAYCSMYRKWALAAHRSGRDDEAHRVRELLEVTHPVGLS